VFSDGKARIIQIKGIDLEAEFGPHMLYVTNMDKPGFIGALGTILGEANINIATFHLGREAADRDAIAIVGVDQVLPEAIQHKLRALPHVRYVKVLRF